MEAAVVTVTCLVQECQRLGRRALPVWIEREAEELALQDIENADEYELN